MKISVIIPVYNVGEFIKKCLYSIINQTLTDGVECIIVNDCTPDGSMDIVTGVLDGYKGNIDFKIINHEYNRGIAAVRNTGVAAAIGDYILYIDGDDYCELDMLENMYNKAIEENADIVGCDYYLTFAEREFYMRVPLSLEYHKNVENIFSGLIPGYVWTILFRRKIWVENNLKNKEGLNHCEDVYMSICLFFFAPKIAYLPKAFVHYVQQNSNSYTHQMNRKTLNCRIEIYTEIKLFLLKNNACDEFKCSFSMYETRLKLILLLNSCGALQKKWNSEYKTSIKGIICTGGVKLHWKVALFFAVCNMLWMFNFIRKLVDLKPEKQGISKRKYYSI